METNIKALEESIEAFKRDSLDCTNCSGICCVSTGFRVTDKDMSRLFSDLPVITDRKKGIKLHDPGTSFIFSDNGDSYLVNCPYLEDGQCSIYPADDRPDTRPRICADAPLYLRREMGFVVINAFNKCPSVMENLDTIKGMAMLHNAAIELYGDPLKYALFLPTRDGLIELKRGEMP